MRSTAACHLHDSNSSMRWAASCMGTLHVSLRLPFLIPTNVIPKSSWAIAGDLRGGQSGTTGRSWSTLLTVLLPRIAGPVASPLTQPFVRPASSRHCNSNAVAGTRSRAIRVRGATCGLATGWSE
jgi:hypothetical protein